MFKKVARLEVDKAIKWIKIQFEKAKKQNAVIGISGGIDSAVVACLCKEALGADNVYGLVMPIESDINASVDALDLANNLGINPIITDLTPSFRKLYLQVINPDLELKEICIYAKFVNRCCELEEKKAAFKVNLMSGNIKSRIRMIHLYAYSEMLNGLVVGTTNKTEYEVGYFTKYGDGGVDIEPIRDFFKTEVYGIAELYFKDVIPKSTMTKAPSADLMSGQTDEEELGITYEKLDEILWTGNNKSEESERIYKILEETGHKKKEPPYFWR